MLRTLNCAICSLAIEDLSSLAVCSGGNTGEDLVIALVGGLQGERSHLTSISQSSFYIFAARSLPSNSPRYAVMVIAGRWRPSPCSSVAGARFARYLRDKSLILSRALLSIYDILVIFSSKISSSLVTESTSLRLPSSSTRSFHYGE